MPKYKSEQNTRNTWINIRVKHYTRLTSFNWYLIVILDEKTTTDLKLSFPNVDGIILFYFIVFKLYISIG